MNRSDILVPINLEKPRFEGLYYAANASSLIPLNVTLLYVVELNIMALERRVYDDLCREYEQRLQNVAQSAFEKEPRLCIRVGQPCEEILAEARDSAAELIVMAAPKHQRRQWFFGPTTVQRVVRDASSQTLVLSESWKLTPQRDRAKYSVSSLNARPRELICN